MFNLLYLLTFLRAQINKAGILWLLGYRGVSGISLAKLAPPTVAGIFFAAGIPEGFGRLFKLESVAMGRPDRANARVQPMSEKGHKRTLAPALRMVCFAG